MGYTTEQKARLDAALKRLDSAKSAYQGQVNSYNEYASAIAPCYTHPTPDAAAASTWFNAFDKGPCTGKGSCDLSKCKDRVDVLNKIIPSLKYAYNEQVAAQANYTKVLDEVTKESLSDPANILNQQAQEQNAELQQHQIDVEAQQRNKNIIYALLAIVIIGAILVGIIKATSKQ